MTTATLRTGYNDDIQKFIRRGCPKERDTIVIQIKKTVELAGKSFAKLFPYKSKRKDVLNHITLYLSVGGICKVESKTLAKNVGCSVRTVSYAVEALKETGEVLVGGLADGKNKYVFVLKSHPNFKSIMKEVFFIDDAEQIAEQNSSENVDVSGPVDENLKSKSFRSFSSIHEKSFIQESVEYDIQNTEKNIVQTREKLIGYTANVNQLMFFDNIISHPFPQAIKDKAGILALRVGMDCDIKRRFKAFQLLNKIAINMSDRVEIHNIVAVFSEGLDKPLDRYKVRAIETPQRKVKKVPFYNWVVNRD